MSLECLNLFAKASTELKDSPSTEVSLQANNEGEGLRGPIARVCLICTKAIPRYTCPRCNVPYCSLPCYKTHSLRCTEAFYKELVQEELRGSREDDKESKRKIMDMLNKEKELRGLDQSTVPAEVQEEDKEGDIGLDEESIERLQQLALEGDLTLDKLSEEEKALFSRAIASGRLGKYIDVWTPWWMATPSAFEQSTRAVRQTGKPLIQEVAAEEDHRAGATSVEGLQRVFPHSGDGSLPSPEKLPKASALLPNHLLNIVYAYAYVMRFYNGEIEDDILGATVLLYELSTVLSADERLATPEVALNQSLQRASEISVTLQSWESARAVAISILRDLPHILDSKLKILDILFHSCQLFKKATTEYDVLDSSVDSVYKRLRKTKSKKMRRSLILALKKLEFFLNWALHSLDDVLLMALSHAVVEFAGTLASASK